MVRHDVETETLSSLRPRRQQQMFVVVCDVFISLPALSSSLGEAECDPASYVQGGQISPETEIEGRGRGPGD